MSSLHSRSERMLRTTSLRAATGDVTRCASVRAAVLLCCLMLCACWLTAQNAPSLILSNGKILTVDPSFSIAQAVAVNGDTITAVGNTADIVKLAGPNTQVIDLKGRTVVPGLM